MNIYLIIILAIIIANYLLNLIVEILNASSARPDLPEEFKDSYNAESYKRSQHYLKENTYFTLIQDTVLTFVILFFILSGSFNFIDQIARGFNLGTIFTGLIFIGILFFGFQIITLPFSIYHTFVIEEKYGFNRTTIKTFILDTIKSWVLTALIGGVVFSAIIWFFMRMGRWAWIWCWLGVTLFEIFLIFISPVVILPLFNKFVPLPEGELKEAVENYARKQNFHLKGIFQMDGSRRSTKANAFFVGWGKYRRIVLFDTLIKKHTLDEIISIVAHEMGHYKKKHSLKSLGVSIIAKGVMFFTLSLFINNPGLFAAFKMRELSIYASLFFFSFLYIPLNMIFSLFIHFLSRKHEYEADAYAVKSYKKPAAYIYALKKLTVDHLSNLTPHPLKVFIRYTHPPVLKRIEAIRKGYSS